MMRQFGSIYSNGGDKETNHLDVVWIYDFPVISYFLKCGCVDQQVLQMNNKKTEGGQGLID